MVSVPAAGCLVDRKSTTSYCTFIGGNLVTWKSINQNMIAHSSDEVESGDMAPTTNEII